MIMFHIQIDVPLNQRRMQGEGAVDSLVVLHLGTDLVGKVGNPAGHRRHRLETEDHLEEPFPATVRTGTVGSSLCPARLNSYSGLCTPCCM